jgi:hypothetical protein
LAKSIVCLAMHPTSLAGSLDHVVEQRHLVP